MSSNLGSTGAISVFCGGDYSDHPPGVSSALCFSSSPSSRRSPYFEDPFRRWPGGLLWLLLLCKASVFVVCASDNLPSLDLPAGEEWRRTGSVPGEVVVRLNKTCLASVNIGSTSISLLELDLLHAQMGCDYTLAALPLRHVASAVSKTKSGGLAVATRGGLEVFSRAALINPDIPMYRHTRTKESLVISMVTLQDGRLLVATTEPSFLVYPNPEASDAQDSPVAELLLGDNVLSLLAWGKGVLAGVGEPELAYFEIPHGPQPSRATTNRYSFRPAWTTPMPGSGYSLLPLPDGGLAVGGLTSIWLFAPDQVRELGVPYSTLILTHYRADALYRLRGGKLAAVLPTGLELFNETAMKNGGQPFSLFKMRSVSCSTQLKSGDVVLGQASGTLHIFDRQILTVGYGAPRVLRPKRMPLVMIALQEDALAVGTEGLSMELLRTSGARPHMFGSSLLRARAPVTTMISLGEGKLAATGPHRHSIDLFDTNRPRLSQYSYGKLLTSSEPLALLLLEDGTIVSGNHRFKIDLFAAADVADLRLSITMGVPPYGTLTVAASISSIARFADGGLAVGTMPGHVYIFDRDTVKSGSGEWSYRLALKASISVTEELRSGLLAVGTLAGNVFLYHPQAGTHPCAALLSGKKRVAAITELENGQVAVAAEEEVLLFDASFEGLDPTLCGQEVLVVRHPESRLPGNGLLGSMLVVEAGKAHPQYLIAGSSVMVPRKCPPMTYGSGRTNGCFPCEAGWLSFQGATSCPFWINPIRTALGTFFFCVGAIFLGLLLSCTFTRLRRMRCSRRRGPLSSPSAEQSTEQVPGSSSCSLDQLGSISQSEAVSSNGLQSNTLASGHTDPSKRRQLVAHVVWGVLAVLLLVPLMVSSPSPLARPTAAQSSSIFSLMILTAGFLCWQAREAARTIQPNTMAVFGVAVGLSLASAATVVEQATLMWEDKAGSSFEIYGCRRVFTMLGFACGDSEFQIFWSLAGLGIAMAASTIFMMPLHTIGPADLPETLQLRPSSRQVSVGPSSALFRESFAVPLESQHECEEHGEDNVSNSADSRVDATSSIDLDDDDDDDANDVDGVLSDQGDPLSEDDDDEDGNAAQGGSRGGGGGNHGRAQQEQRRRLTLQEVSRMGVDVSYSSRSARGSLDSTGTRESRLPLRAVWNSAAAGGTGCCDPRSCCGSCCCLCFGGLCLEKDACAESCWRRCRCLHPIYYMGMAAKNFIVSWHGRHLAVVANSSLSIAGLVYQFVGSARTARRSVLYLAIGAASLSFLVSSTALLLLRLRKKLMKWGIGRGRRSWIIDQHFRYTVLFKVGLLMCKAMLLAMPVTNFVTGCTTIWSCGPTALCPEWCLEKPSGFCALVENKCACISYESNALILLLNFSTSTCVFGLTMQDLAAFFTARIPPMRPSLLKGLRARIALFGAGGVNLAQFISAVMLSWMPATCYMLDFQSILLISLPAGALALLANEAKWVLKSWPRQPMKHGPVYESLALRFYALLSSLFSGAGALLLPVEPGFGPEWEWCFTVHQVQRAILAFATIASLSCLLLQPRRRPRHHHHHHHHHQHHDYLGSGSSEVDSHNQLPSGNDVRRPWHQNSMLSGTAECQQEQEQERGKKPRNESGIDAATAAVAHGNSGGAVVGADSDGMRASSCGSLASMKQIFAHDLCRVDAGLVEMTSFNTSLITNIGSTSVSLATRVAEVDSEA